MPKILIVDDDEQIRRLLVEWLHLYGYDTIEAENGHKAVEVCKGASVDLAIIDLIMPGQDGIETIVQFRKEYPDIKLIAISGGLRNGSLDVLPAAQYLGAMRTFSKPVSFPALFGAIKELLGIDPSAPSE